jgi:hypothetical protein
MPASRRPDPSRKTPAKKSNSLGERFEEVECTELSMSRREKAMKINRVAAASSAVATCAAMFVLTSGVANATTYPDVIGKTYADAKGIVWSSQMKPVVGTIVGDRGSQDQCRVVSMTKVTARDGRGNVITPQALALNLSCYPKPASASAPGVSAGNFAPDAEAIRAADAADTRKWKQSANGQEWCEKTYSEHPEWTPDPDCQLDNQ